MSKELVDKMKTIEGVVELIHKYSFQKSHGLAKTIPSKIAIKLSEEELQELDGIVVNASKGAYIPENSLMGSRITEILPNGSLIDALKKRLNPEYMNTVFTWKQIKDAITERII